jgi:hypothetical protein
MIPPPTVSRPASGEPAGTVSVQLPTAQKRMIASKLV